MEERLQKIIASAGLMSRRDAEEYIKRGRVTVNGETARLGDRADIGADEIAIDGKPIPQSGERVYIMLNKPRGYVTTMSDDKGRKTVSELTKDAGARLVPAGRLDMYSEGLLILTNDGEAVYRLTHPSAGVRKTYHVRVSGEIAERAAELLRGVTELSPGCEPIRPAKVDIINEEDGTARLAVTIGEGKNRQVRRMCESVGLKVLRLKRVSEGKLKLGKLEAGKWRYLTEAEVEYLRSL